MYSIEIDGYEYPLTKCWSGGAITYDSYVDEYGKYQVKNKKYSPMIFDLEPYSTKDKPKITDILRRFSSMKLKRGSNGAVSIFAYNQGDYEVNGNTITFFSGNFLN